MTRRQHRSNWRDRSGRNDNANRIQTKVSFGVILVRKNAATNRPEAVVVRGRYSYEYSEFVHGQYSRKNPQAIINRLSAMTVNERVDIYSLNFAQMWYRIWLTSECRERYNKKLAKFQMAWMRDDSGDYLRRLVQQSQALATGQGGETHWEFPKGKRESPRESDISCAVREFKEETGIDKKDYQILPGFKRRVAYTHMGTQYVNVYYVAVARREIEPKLDFRDLGQVSEISEVRWMDIEKIRMVDTPERRLETTIAPAFKYVKRHNRGALSLRSNVAINDAYRALGNVRPTSGSSVTID